MQFSEVNVDFDARKPSGRGLGISALSGQVEIWEYNSSGGHLVGLLDPDVAHELAKRIEEAAVTADRQRRDGAAI